MSDTSRTGFDTSVAGTHGTLYLNSATGAYEYVLTSNIEGWDDGETFTEQFTFSVSDGDDALVTQPYNVVISGANDLSDGDEVVTIDEDTTATGPNLLANVVDPEASDTHSITQFQVEGDTTVYQAGQTVEMDGVGSLTINSDGSYSFVPLANYSGPVPVATYTVTDGTDTDTSTLTINVNEVLDPPVIYDGSDWQVGSKLIQPKGTGNITFTAGGKIHFDFYVTDPDAQLSITPDDLAALNALGLDVSITEVRDGSNNTTFFRVSVTNTTDGAVVIDNSQKVGLEWANVSKNLSEVGFINSDEYVLLNNDGNSAPLITGPGNTFDAYDPAADNSGVDLIWASSDPNGQEFVQAIPITEPGETIDGGAGNDIIFGDPGIDSADVSNDVISGGAGSDIIDGRAGTDTLLGDEGDDVIFGGYGDDTINGGADNDLLFGGLGNDSLAGGTGNDVLVGGKGNDILSGGEGDDIFRFDVGDADGSTDTITDFDIGNANGHGNDVLDISDLLDPSGSNVIDSTNIGDYLDASFDNGTGQTTISVFSGGDATDPAATPDQVIVVNGDLATDLNMLVDNGTIVVDNS
ncbi:hypothetical protein GCM10009104_21190 [Marinobacterium maritimum]|uniref:Cadherin-like domain-containing protein n=1 Tax=Marinobacterium maritimum TaxID=500162 RepID=A0ABN1I6Z0_9GAMM